MARSSTSTVHRPPWRAPAGCGRSSTPSPVSRSCCESTPAGPESCRCRSSTTTTDRSSPTARTPPPPCTGKSWKRHDRPGAPVADRGLLQRAAPPVHPPGPARHHRPAPAARRSPQRQPPAHHRRRVPRQRRRRIHRPPVPHSWGKPVTFRTLPHGPYIEAIEAALTEAKLTPEQADAFVEDSYDVAYLRGVITLTPESSGIPAVRYPHGLILIWDWHTGTDEDYDRGPVWQW